MNEMIQSLGGTAADHLTDVLRHIRFREDSSADGVIHIVMNIGNFIGKSDDLALQGMGLSNGLVVSYTVSHLVGQIQPLAILLQNVHGADALFGMFEAKRAYSVQRTLSGMSERRVSQIVSQRNGFHQILVQL